MSARLPYELIGATLAFSDIAELQAAACASRALQLQAEPHLYRHALLAKTGSAAAVYNNLVRCAERARYVRGLIVADSGVARAQLSSLLALLQNLKILQLRVCADGIEMRAYPFKLKELSIYADGDALDADKFVQFLTDCGGQALRRLELPLSSDLARHAALAAHVGSNTGSLGNVTTLRASYEVILAFIRAGVPLQHIFAPSSDLVQDKFFKAIEEAKCDLRTLHGVRTPDGYDLLKTLGKVCPRLDSVELIIDSVRTFTIFTLLVTGHQVEKRPALHPELRSLSVRVISADGRAVPTTEWMMRSIPSCCPKLLRLNGHALL